MSRFASLNTWLAAGAVLLCLQLPAQAQERFTLNVPGVSDNRLFTPASASDAKGCGGHNLSPALAWTAGPEGTRSYAIVMHDPDGAKGQGIDHWVHYGIKPTTRQIAAGAGPRAPWKGWAAPTAKAPPATSVLARRWATVRTTTSSRSTPWSWRPTPCRPA